MLNAMHRFLVGEDGGEAARTPSTAPHRVGVIDMGSNSVRMVVFDRATRSPAIFYNEKVLCGLGETLATDGRLSAKGREQASAALERFKALAGRMKLGAMDVIATAAVRDAEDGADFVAEIEQRVGLKIRVASGADEARLSAQGVLLGDPEADGVAADMGGASLELARVRGGEVSDEVTTALGPLRLSAVATQGWRKFDAFVDKQIEAQLKERPSLRRPEALYALGGSWRALVKAHMRKTDYPLKVLHGFTLDPESAYRLAVWGSKLDAAALRELAEVSERRARVTPLAARVLARLIKRSEPRRVTLSAFGLREGALWEHMPERLRREDPLLDAARSLERRSARTPGFGHELWRWLAPALPDLGERDSRLAPAACLLADVSWRTHPDYRALASFELMTRNNYGGVTHADRIFTAAALMHRYKGGRTAMRREPAMTLIDDERARRAEILGRGMRLGIEFTGAAAGILPRCPLIRDSETLVLALKSSEAALGGDGLEKALQSFAEMVGASASEIRLID